MRNPKASFCLLFYNQASFVQQALRGAFGQDYDNYDILIRDDCSTDSTKEEIKKYLESNQVGNLKVIVDYGTENIGIIKSFNRLLSLTDAEIIVSQGGDDFSLPNRVATCADLLTRYDVDLVGTDAIIIDQDNHKLCQSYYYRDGKNILSSIIDFEEIAPNTLRVKKVKDEAVGFAYFGGFSISFRKDLLKSVGGVLPPAMTFEDRFLTFLAIINKGAILYVDPLVHYRRHKGNASIKIFLKRRDQVLYMLEMAMVRSAVCQSQIAYLENGNYVDPKYDRQEIIHYLKMENDQVMLFNACIDNSARLRIRWRIMQLIIDNPVANRLIKFQAVMETLCPALHRYKALKKYKQRLSFFGIIASEECYDQ